MKAVAGVLNALSSAQMTHNFTTLQQSADQHKGRVCGKWLSLGLAQSEQTLLAILHATRWGLTQEEACIHTAELFMHIHNELCIIIIQMMQTACSSYIRPVCLQFVRLVHKRHDLCSNIMICGLCSTVMAVCA